MGTELGLPGEGRLKFTLALPAITKLVRQIVVRVKSDGDTWVCFLAGGLQRVARGLAPAGGEDVAAVELGPVVECSLPPVEGDVDAVVVDGADRGAADQVRVLLVHRLQLLPYHELVSLRCARLFLETPTNKNVK